MANLSSSPAVVTVHARTWDWHRIRGLIGKALAYLILGAGAFIISIPWTWMLLTSLKTPADILRLPLTILPTEWMWGNYVEVLFGTSRPLWRYIQNSLVIVFFVELGTLLSNTIIAFGFSRLRWKYRNAVFIAVLATMMLPAQVTMIPLFTLFTIVLKWGDTYLPLIVPSFFGSAWAIFLLRQYMLTIPRELDDAARIDGCSTLQLFLRIIVPLSAPALAVLAVFTFNATWNDFFTPLLYIQKQSLLTVAQIVAGLGGAAGIGQLPRYDLLMAASVLTSLPMVLLFFLFQRQFIQGVVITGVKG